MNLILIHANPELDRCKRTKPKIASVILFTYYRDMSLKENTHPIVLSLLARSLKGYCWGPYNNSNIS
jgi:hypothetical protein